MESTVEENGLELSKVWRAEYELMASVSCLSFWWLECNGGSQRHADQQSGRQGHLIGRTALSKETRRTSTGWVGLKTHLDEVQ